MPTGLGIVAAPVTYKLNGKQYVSVLVGWGGTLAGTFGIGVGEHGWDYGRQPRRLLTFALGGKAQLPPTPLPQSAVPLDDSRLIIDVTAALKGRSLYNTTCALCHGWEGDAGGAAPDLRASQLALKLDTFSTVLKEGPFAARGMAKFDDLTDDEIQQIHMFLRQRARKDIANRKPATEQ
jgi:quinohemoprotein ethanol dehydrogenase